MNKKVFLNLLTIIMVTMLSVVNVSCSNDDEVIPEIIVPEGKEDFFAKSMDFDSPAAEKSFTFSTNVPWTISISETRDGNNWLSVSPTSGKAGTNTITVKAAENTTYDNRNSVISVIAGDSIRNIFVNQKQLDALTLTSNRFEVPVTGGIISIEVKANIDYKVVIPDEFKKWIHKKSSSTRGLSASTINFTIDKSEEYDKREGKILITSNNKEEVVTIYQTGEGILTLTSNEYNLNSFAHELTIEINSNFDYAVEFPEVDWIKEITSNTRGISTHTLRLAISENEEYDGRSAKIKIYDKNSSLFEEVMINQSQKNALYLEKKEFEFDENGGTFSLEINSNIDYKTKINCDWITETTTKTRSLAKSSHIFTVSANSDNGDREGSIVFYDTPTGISEKVIVKQYRSIFFESSTLTLIEGAEKVINITNKTSQGIIWSSSNKSAVSVDNTGKIKAIKRGKSTITASTVDGKHTCKCEVTVQNITDCISMMRTGSASSITPWGSNYAVTFKISNSSSETIHIVSLAGVTNGVERNLKGGDSVEITIASTLPNIQNNQQTLVYTYKGKQYSLKG